MAKKSSIEKNDKRKRLVELSYKKRKELKDMIYDKTKSLSERFALVKKLAKLPRNGAITRVRNRCELTGRPRGYYRKFKISRNEIRRLSGSGSITGLVKSSW